VYKTVSYEDRKERGQVASNIRLMMNCKQLGRKGTLPNGSSTQHRKMLEGLRRLAGVSLCPGRNANRPSPE
jgi:hypothetical protein